MRRMKSLENDMRLRGVVCADTNYTSPTTLRTLFVADVADVADVAVVTDAAALPVHFGLKQRYFWVDSADFHF